MHQVAEEQESQQEQAWLLRLQEQIDAALDNIQNSLSELARAISTGQFRDVCRLDGAPVTSDDQEYVVSILRAKQVGDIRRVRLLTGLSGPVPAYQLFEGAIRAYDLAQGEDSDEE